PFTAARTAFIVLALGEIEDHRRRFRSGRFWSGLGFLRVRALRLGSNRSGKRHHECSKKVSYRFHERTIGLHWLTPLANRNLKQREHEPAHIYAAPNRTGKQPCDQAKPLPHLHRGTIERPGIAAPTGRGGATSLGQHGARGPAALRSRTIAAADPCIHLRTI